jgi:hypothetical protein
MDSLSPADVLAASRAAGRIKPWGTAHALLCAKDAIDAPFLVINADDFYGREAFDAMGSYLSGADVREGAIVPYRLAKTLSPMGTVTRGVCEIRGGYLQNVEELTAIARAQDGGVYNTAADGSRRALEDATPVSMNFWGFPPLMFPHLKRYFDEFLSVSASQPKAECYLPQAADWFVKNRLLAIRALDADSPWFGVTYREDRETAVERIGGLAAAGTYPARLWE